MSRLRAVHKPSARCPRAESPPKVTTDSDPQPNDNFPDVLRIHQVADGLITNQYYVNPVIPITPVTPVFTCRHDGVQLLTATARPNTATACLSRPVQTPEGWNVLLLLDNNRNSPIHPVPTSPRGKESYASPRHSMVSPGQLVPTPHRGRTPTQDRQMVSHRSTGPTIHRRANS